MNAAQYDAKRAELEEMRTRAWQCVRDREASAKEIEAALAALGERPADGPTVEWTDTRGDKWVWTVVKDGPIERTCNGGYRTRYENIADAVNCVPDDATLLRILALRYGATPVGYAEIFADGGVNFTQRTDDPHRNIPLYRHPDPRVAALEAINDRQYNRIATLERACAKLNDEVSQTLGKALGYPWYKDDQKNFPGAVANDGVCVGPEVAESLAEQAATRIHDLETELKRAQSMNETYRGDIRELQNRAAKVQVEHEAEVARLTAIPAELTDEMITRGINEYHRITAYWPPEFMASRPHVEKLVEGIVHAVTAPVEPT